MAPQYPQSSLPTPPPRPPNTPSYLSPPNAWRSEARWGLGDAIVALVVFFVSSLIISVAVIVGAETRGADVDLTVSRFLPVLLGVSNGAEALYIWWAMKTKGAGIVRELAYRFKASDMGIGIGLGIAGLFAAALVGVLTTEILGREPDTAVVDALDPTAADLGIHWTTFITLLMLPIVAPLVEELTFRGLLWGALIKRGMSDGAALVITSAVFAGIHLEPERFLILFALGLMLGLARLITGRVGASIVAHAVVNGLASIALFFELT